MSSEAIDRLNLVAMAIGHELRNDMLSISMHAHLLAGRLPDDPSAAALVRSAERARATVEDLVALARETKAFEAVRISSVISSARLELNAIWIDHLVDDPTVRAHGSLLARAIATLYRNAIAMSQGRPTITTRVSTRANRVVIEIEDDGPGVATSVMTTLFEPLVSARPGGTGIGLAMCKWIVALHEGEVALVQGQPHAVFRVELPLLH